MPETLKSVIFKYIVCYNLLRSTKSKGFWRIVQSNGINYFSDTEKYR